MRGRNISRIEITNQNLPFGISSFLGGKNGEERKMLIIGPEGDGDYTRYFLDNPKKAHKIEVFVMKDYLKEKLGLEFRPRPVSKATK